MNRVMTTPMTYWYTPRPRNNFPSLGSIIRPTILLTAVIIVAASSPPPLPPPGTLAALFREPVETERASLDGNGDE